MHYCVYLDEFGHVGPYVSCAHSRFNDHPIFGLAGLALPVKSIRHFNTWFYKLKGDLLSFEIERDYRDKGIPEYQWEKKGSSLYTFENIKKYRQLRNATNRLLNKIQKCDGFIFYVGQAKPKDQKTHDPKKAYQSAIQESLKRLQAEFESTRSTFSLVLDEHTERAEIYQHAAVQMFKQNITRLIEPPYEVDSKLYQSMQCADWICGLVGRLAFYKCEPDSKPNWKIFHDYFNDRITRAQRRSGIRTYGTPSDAKLNQLLLKFNA